MNAAMDVREAIVGALTAAYPGIPVFAEGKAPETTVPRFVVKSLPVVHTHVMGPRYVRKHSVDVRYVPASANEPGAEMFGVAEKLAEELELIPCGGGWLHGTGMRFDIADGALLFNVTYEVQLIKQAEPAPLMGTAEMKEGTK